MTAGVTVAVWRIATDTPTYQAHDLRGEGARLSGGRWNRPGRAVVYAANSIALACLETVAHLNAGGLPLNRFLVRIDIPQDIWAARVRRTAAELPVGWTATPKGQMSLNVGDEWLLSGASALLQLPSVIVPEESNVLINPAHPDAARIQAVKLRSWYYDSRLG